ncbi:MAG: low molecular weight phosphotyrosine protein phosphatase [Gammaproteobacteria bacterium]|nr:low molecular weight phosphotyrosine protein phosphatase [Gammaproteobacteria bacterium]
MHDVDFSILFCCMGNICRSPTAEGVFRKIHLEMAPQLKLHIDSAGTHDYHVGQPPDKRAIAAARLRSIDISAHRGRMVTADDYSQFDFILAMDNANLSQLHLLRPDASSAKLSLLLEFAEECELTEVPDPYYGGTTGFEQVLELTQQGSIGFLRHLCRKQGIALEFPDIRLEKKPARS